MDKSIKNNIWKVLIKSVLFILIGLTLFLYIPCFLSMPKGKEWAVQTGMNLVHQNPNRYDVLEVGTSTVIANISNQELYEKYGISAVSIGEPEQPVYLSHYVLEDALENQKPIVVLLDSKAFFYSEEWSKARATNEVDYILHNSIDSIRSYSIKLKAIKKAKKYYLELDNYDFLLPMYYNHSNWKYISEEGWKNDISKDCMNGNIALFSIASEVGEPYRDGNEIGIASQEINEEALKELNAIKSLCEEKQVSLILVTGYITFTKDRHNAMQKVADDLQVPYIDINEIADTISLDNKTDIAEGGSFAHLNLSGALKWSDYLGEYLSESYLFEDCRKNGGIKQCEEQRFTFAEQKQFMECQLKLGQAIDFQSYLEVLSELDLSRYAVFVSVYDEGTKSMSTDDYSVMSKLGLIQYEQVGNRESYVASITDQGVREIYDKENAVALQGSIDEKDYVVSSGGFYHSTEATIKINGIEYMQCGRGINIVVYDRLIENVVESVFFDTSASANPPKQRYGHNDRAIQTALGPNRWEYGV